ncbi:MAG: hypothetical protein A2X86_11610 [Bdellovibrionales bacterium GWA2_49_15]|nr:MAG: hypothetical protein A2X86_11610 [Bdellovibrionales bacterium GWA2_49_15]HAZ12602.1 hypothetical protein [Bdellovibrionales bacterium]
MVEQNQALTHSLYRATRVIVVGPMPLTPERDLEQLPLAACPTLFIDGGKTHQDHFNHTPSLSIGDGDSYKGPLDLILPKNKNISDLKAGLDLLSSEVEEIYFLGLCGGRKDHELINLGEIYHFLLRQQVPCRAFFDKDFHAVQKGTYELSYQGIFSLLAFQNTLVTLTGQVEYQLAQPTLLQSFSSQGLSNQSHGIFTLSCNLPIFLLLPGGALWPRP